MSPNGLEIEVEEQGFPRVSGDEPSTGEEAPPHDRFPRVSGDEPIAQLRAILLSKFSPRERG